MKSRAPLSCSQGAVVIGAAAKGGATVAIGAMAGISGGGSVTMGAMVGGGGMVGAVKGGRVAMSPGVVVGTSPNTAGSMSPILAFASASMSAKSAPMSRAVVVVVVVVVVGWPGEEHFRGLARILGHT